MRASIPRRGFMAIGAAALVSPLAAPAIAAESASRSFRIIRDGDDIGTHTLEAVRSGDGFEIEIVIRIAVKILGITAYRYELDNRERWQGRQLVGLDARTNDDGTDDFARAERRGETLTIEGSRNSGTLPDPTVTTSYYANPFLERRPWLSTQSGALIDVAISQQERAGWWRVTGELNTELGYDDRGEWVACEFDAGGEPAHYEVTGQSGAIGALWSGA